MLNKACFSKAPPKIYQCLRGDRRDLIPENAKYVRLLIQRAGYRGKVGNSLFMKDFNRDWDATEKAYYTAKVVAATIHNWLDDHCTSPRTYISKWDNTTGTYPGRTHREALNALFIKYGIVELPSLK